MCYVKDSAKTREKKNFKIFKKYLENIIFKLFL